MATDSLLQSANGAMLSDEAFLRIARDLLARPDGRRGGYVITDAQLRRMIKSIERRRAILAAALNSTGENDHG